MGKLAINGGVPALSRAEWPVWPRVTAAEELAVLTALRQGDFTGLQRNGSVQQLEERWAAEVGAGHCIAVANGTAAITLALAASGVQPGDDVLVPALTFIAPALAVAHLGARPIFVDVDPVSFNICAADLRRKVTPRSTAVVVVHLHGLAADMDEIAAVAAEFRLAVVEDAAQAQGAVYRGRKIGSLSPVTTFSLSISKNLPTCGEGGLITTNDAGLAASITRLRQFGEDLIPGMARSYEHHDIGWNNKMNGVQSAFTLSLLGRFGADNAIRQRQVGRFLQRLSGLPGLICPSHPADRTHVWHILRFRFAHGFAAAHGVSAASLRKAMQRVLQAEGCPVREYQTMPLSAQPVFRSAAAGTWAARFYDGRPLRFDRQAVAHSCDIVGDSFVLQKFHLVPGADAVLEKCADAFEKAYAQLDFVIELARAQPYAPPWPQETDEESGKAA